MIRKIKIAYLITGLTVGGAEMQVYKMVTGLDKSRFEPIVISMMDRGAVGGKIMDEGAPVYTLGMKKGKPSLAAVFKLRRILKRERPCILHCHMVHANILGALVTRFIKIPILISTIHNIYFGSGLREKITAYTAKMNDVYTIISRIAADRMIGEGILPKHKLMVIPNGVDTSAFASLSLDREAFRQSLGLPEGTFVWLAAGRFSEQKNYPCLLKAFRKALQNRSDSMLLIAGDGLLKLSMEKLSQDLGVAEKVRFLGVRNDLPSLMKTADAFVMSSSWEGMPMVILEAGAAGLPVVSTRVGGVPELIEDDRTGILTDPNEDSLAEGMVKMTDLSPRGRRRMGRAIQNHIRKHFELGSILKQWEELYLRLVRSKGLEYIKVAHIATVQASIRTILADKLNGLSERGYEVHAIASPDPSQEGIGLDEVKFHGLPMKRSISPVGDVLSLLRMRNLLKREKFDIVHTHTAKAGFIGRLAAKLAGVPIILHTSHGLPFHEGQNKLIYHIYRMMEKLAARLTDCLLCQNKHDMKAAISHKLMDKKQVIYEGNGVNLEVLDQIAKRVDRAEKKAELGLGDEIIIGFYSRLERVKGHSYFFRSYKRLVDRGYKVVCLLAGEGPLEEKLRKQAEELELGKFVKFLGFRKDIPELLAITDVLVLPSEKEGIPRVVMEAMAMKIPVVATNVMGTKELVRHRKTGILIPHGDEEELTRALIELMEHPDIRQQYGEAGWRRVVRFHDEEQVIQRVDEVYQKLLRQKSLIL